MYDFLMNVLSYLNIDPNVVGAYDSLMAVLSSFSLLVSIVGAILNRKKIIDVDEMVESFVSIFHKKGDKRIKAADVILVADLCLSAINIAKLFVTIPTDLYAVLLVITAISAVVTAFFVIAKVLLALIFLCFGIGEIFEDGFLFICMLIGVIIIVASAAVNAFQAVMNFNQVLTILREIR